MTKPVKMYDLAVSPNSIKVRLALAYKKIPYEKISVDPQNREPVIKVSGQPLTPVLLHGETVVYDSYAIVRYLDANWPDTPRLFSADKETMKEIEKWELFGRMEAGAGVRMTFGEAFAKTPNVANLKKANELMNEAASKVEKALSPGNYLVGNQATAADLTVATFLYYGAMTPEAAKSHPIGSIFFENLKITNAPKTLSWISNLMAWDR